MKQPCSRLSLMALGAAALLAGTGCELRQAMYNQPKLKPLQASEFFADGQASRPLVEGTVARGFLQEDTHFYEGKTNGQDVAEFPMPVDAALLARGQDRYNIFCAPCHDQAGTGQGMIVKRGFKQPPSYHIDRLRQAPAGYFYGVIKNGFGTMSGYSHQIKPEDRWAIVAYVRALQLSQHATLEDVPEGERAQLQAH